MQAAWVYPQTVSNLLRLLHVCAESGNLAYDAAVITYIQKLNEHRLKVGMGHCLGGACLPGGARLPLSWYA